MATGNPTVTVHLRAEDQNLESELDGIKGRLSAFTMNLAGAAQIAQVAFQAIGKVASVVGDLITASNEAENALHQTASLLEATGRGGDAATEQLAAYAKELQRATTIGDDAVIAASRYLIVMQNIATETIPLAIQAAADLAAVMGTDLEGAVQSVARALEDPEMGLRALRSAGVMLTDQQRDMIKTFKEAGDEATAQQMVLDELEKRFGGQAQEKLGTFAGKMEHLSEAWGDVKEVMGDVIKEAFIPLAEELIQNEDLLDGLVELIKAFIPAMQAIGEAIAATARGAADLGRALKDIDVDENILKILTVSPAAWVMQKAGGARREEIERGQDLDEQIRINQRKIRQMEREQREQEREEKYQALKAQQAMAEEQEKMQKAQAAAQEKAVREAEAEMKRLVGMADKWRQAFASPFEVAAQKIQEINGLTSRGFMSIQERERALQLVRDEFVERDNIAQSIERSQETIQRHREKLADINERLMPKDQGFTARFEGIESLSNRIQAAALSRPAQDTTRQELIKTREETLKAMAREEEIFNNMLIELRRRQEYAARFGR